MTAPPSRSAFFASPDHAAAKSIIQQWFDYVVERLGGTSATASAGEKDAACEALGALRKTGGTMTGTLNLPSLNGGQLAGLRNLLINGGMEINQRGLTSVADDTYCLDRWYVLTETGNVTVAQLADQENGTPFNIRLTQPDVTGKQIALAQIIEASVSKTLRGKAASLAARIRNSHGGQVNYAVLEWTGTADVVTSDVISAWAAAPTFIGNVTERAKGSITPAVNTWTDAPGLEAVINASTNNLIVLIWSDADMPQNATLDIARVQLEVGSVASAFEHRPRPVELAMCQRYYFKTYDPAVVPGSANAFSGALSSPRVYTNLVQVVMLNVVFPVEMRASPSITLFSSASGASGLWRNSGGVDYTVGVTNVGSRSCTVWNTATIPSDSILTGHTVANAEL